MQVNASTRLQNLCICCTVRCRKSLACAKWMNQVKHIIATMWRHSEFAEKGGDKYQH